MHWMLIEVTTSITNDFIQSFFCCLLLEGQKHLYDDSILFLLLTDAVLSCKKANSSVNEIAE